MKTKKLTWINPISHYVYQGWLSFLDKYFKLTIYDGKYIDVTFGNHHKLEHSRSLHFLGNYFNIIKNKGKIINSIKEDYVIIGDIFTIDLPFLCIFRKKTIFYSEFFFRPANENWKRKLLFYISAIPFTRKKFVVPTRVAYNTIKRISKKILYFPPIYHGGVHNNKSLSDKKMKILIVGCVNDWKKNFKTLFYALNDLHKIGYDFELHIVGRNEDPHFFDDIEFDYTYHGIVDHDSLSKIYLKCNLFILPSLMDPIGAVGIEAMAHSLPVIFSKNAGVADYITKGVSGFTFNPLSKGELKKAIIKYFNYKTRKKHGKANKKLIEMNHWYKNSSLLEERYAELINFFEH